MSVVTPPPVVRSDEQEELEALIREARARGRRRRLLLVAGVLAATGIGLALWTVLSGGGETAAQISGRGAGSVSRSRAAVAHRRGIGDVGSSRGGPGGTS